MSLGDMRATAGRTRPMSAANPFRAESPIGRRTFNASPRSVRLSATREEEPPTVSYVAREPGSPNASRKV